MTGVGLGVDVIVAPGLGCRKYGLNCRKLPHIGWKSASLSYSSSLWLLLSESESESEKTVTAVTFHAGSCYNVSCFLGLGFRSDFCFDSRKVKH